MRRHTSWDGLTAFQQSAILIMHLESVMYVATESNKTVFSPSHEPLLDFLMSAFYFSKTFSVVDNIVYNFLLASGHSYATLKGGIFLHTIFVKYRIKRTEMIIPRRNNRNLQNLCRLLISLRYRAVA